MVVFEQATTENPHGSGVIRYSFIGQRYVVKHVLTADMLSDPRNNQRYAAYNLSLAAFVAEHYSEDPSTQVGALLRPHTPSSTPNGSHPILDCNRCVGGTQLTAEELNTRETKYKFVEHAERNTIYGAANQGTCTLGSVLYATWYACCDCARAIVASGVGSVYGLAEFSSRTRPEWKENIYAAQRILLSGGVKCQDITTKTFLEWGTPTVLKLSPQSPHIITRPNRDAIIGKLNNSQLKLDPRSEEVYNMLTDQDLPRYYPKLRFNGDVLDFNTFR